MWYSYMNGWGWNMTNYRWGWFLPLVILDHVLKGIALWRSAQRKEKWWFIFLLIVNSLGILPGIYLLTHPEAKSAKKK